MTAQQDAAIAQQLAALHAEIRLLRSTTAMRHGWLRHAVRDLETDPHQQYRVHKYGMYYWLINFPIITLLFFFEPALWLKLGIFITLIYSIYANFATDYAGLSAAMAAFGDDPPPPIPLEPPIDLPARGPDGERLYDHDQDGL